MTTLSRPGGALGRELRAMYAFIERNANLFAELKVLLGPDAVV